MVPSGKKPPSRSAVSFRIGEGPPPSVTVVGFGVVVSVGLAALTVTNSLRAFVSLAV